MVTTISIKNGTWEQKYAGIIKPSPKGEEYIHTAYPATKASRWQRRVCMTSNLISRRQAIMRVWSKLRLLGPLRLTATSRPTSSKAAHSSQRYSFVSLLLSTTSRQQSPIILQILFVECFRIVRQLRASCVSARRLCK